MLLPSPWAPWKGAPLRVMLATEKLLQREFSLTGPDGSVAALKVPTKSISLGACSYKRSRSTKLLGSYQPMVIRTSTIKMAPPRSGHVFVSRLTAAKRFALGYAHLPCSAQLRCGLVARGSYLASAARARCLSIRWRHSAYSVVPGRDSNDLHHSSSESSRCIDEQLPSTSTASKNPNLGIIATFPRNLPQKSPPCDFFPALSSPRLSS